MADFGGGTSDFSIVRLRPSSTIDADRRYEILANDGVAIAGDAFDGEIVRRLVAPELGRGSQYKTPYGQVLPMPTWFYAQMERWHFLSFLKAPTTMNKLRDLKHQALAPEKIRALIHIVENDLGYLLFKSVEQTKLALSDADATTFRFADAAVCGSRSPRRARPSRAGSRASCTRLRSASIECWRRRKSCPMPSTAFSSPADRRSCR